MKLSIAEKDMGKFYFLPCEIQTKSNDSTNWENENLPFARQLNCPIHLTLVNSEQFCHVFCRYSAIEYDIYCII